MIYYHAYTSTYLADTIHEKENSSNIHIAGNVSISARPLLIVLPTLKHRVLISFLTAIAVEHRRGLRFETGGVVGVFLVPLSLGTLSA